MLNLKYMPSDHLNNLLWDILRLPCSHRAGLGQGLYVILTLWRGWGVNQPPYALLHRSSLSYALRHGEMTRKHHYMYYDVNVLHPLQVWEMNKGYLRVPENVRKRSKGQKEGQGHNRNKLNVTQIIFLDLTLKVLNFWKFTSCCSLEPLWSAMGEVVPTRTSPTLHPPSPPTVHQLSWLAL